MDRGGDLLTITTEEEKKAIAAKIKYTSNIYYWISLNDRDYRNFHYWSNNDADGVINWGSGAPDKSGYTSMKIFCFLDSLISPNERQNMAAIRKIYGMDYYFAGNKSNKNNYKDRYDYTL